ncbi:MAG: hypothetical protein H7301_11965 [Cryobacterium sp.]|nr:hypothetical protein [Oligoflexia bacterium]
MKESLMKIVFVLGTIFTISIVAAHASPVKHSKGAKTSHVGEALRRKKTLEFDGRTVESLRGGNYDSVSHLDDGGASSGKRLYSLPRDFSYRVADEKMEMRYRK